MIHILSVKEDGEFVEILKTKDRNEVLFFIFNNNIPDEIISWEIQYGVAS